MTSKKDDRVGFDTLPTQTLAEAIAAGAGQVTPAFREMVRQIVEAERPVLEALGSEVEDAVDAALQADQAAQEQTADAWTFYAIGNNVVDVIQGGRQDAPDGPRSDDLDSAGAADLETCQHGLPRGSCICWGGF